VSSRGATTPEKKGTTAVPPRGSKKARPAAGRPAAGRPANQTSHTRQEKWQSRRRRNKLLAVASVVAVVAVVAVFVIVKATGGSSVHATGRTSGAGTPRQPAPEAVIAKLTGIPVPALTQAVSKVSGLQPLKPVSGPPLTSGGKPEILYIGAEYCPICATERWPLLVALGHFGTFANVSETHSAVADGNLATVTFYGSTFTSQYLTFTPVEVTTNEPSGNFYKPLETPTAAQNAIWKTFEPQQQSFPFTDFGGKAVLETSQYPAQVISGHSFTDIVNAIGSNNSTIGSSVDASAAMLVKELCGVTGQQPAATCQAVAGVPSPTGAASGGATSPSS
jgi:hypothetical protein